MPFRDLHEILNLIVGWEKELKDLYDVAEVALRDEKSRKLVSLLRDRVVKNLQVLVAVNLETYGEAAWVRYSSELRAEDVVPKTKLRKDSTPKEILERILECEEKLRDFYATIRDLLASPRQEELFSSLVTFKTGQIIEIKSSMESIDLI